MRRERFECRCHAVPQTAESRIGVVRLDAKRLRLKKTVFSLDTNPIWMTPMVPSPQWFPLYGFPPGAAPICS
jgi:hypothetical protein